MPLPNTPATGAAIVVIHGRNAEQGLNANFLKEFEPRL